MRFSQTELLLLLLKNSGDQAIRGRTRFQKIVFLLEEQGIDFGYRFKPYLYGPYSEDLNDDINMLTGLGLLSVDSEEVESDGIVYDRYVYSLTEEGREMADVVEKRWGDTKRFRELTSNIENLSTGSLIISAKYIMNNKLIEQSAGSAH